MTTKVIFLDFDGVLNDLGWSYYVTQQGLTGGARLSPSRVFLLNHIIDKTQAEVVITSSWRKINSREAMIGFMTSAGFTGVVRDILPRNTKEAPLRGDLITQWLREHGEDVSHYVILEDDIDATMETEHANAYVKTSLFLGGLNFQAVLDTLEILQK